MNEQPQNTSAAGFTEPRSYKPQPQLPNYNALPFVRTTGRGKQRKRKLWAIPKGKFEYFEAERVGQSFAAHYAQFLKDNPRSAGMGMLGSFVEQMNLNPKSRERGFIVGFFAYLERMLLKAAEDIDVFASLNKRIAWSRDVEAAWRQSCELEDAARAATTAV